MEPKVTKSKQIRTEQSREKWCEVCETQFNILFLHKWLAIHETKIDFVTENEKKLETDNLVHNYERHRWQYNIVIDRQMQSYVSVHISKRLVLTYSRVRFSIVDRVQMGRNESTNE